MKKILYFSAPAFLAVCTLALPLSADTLNGGLGTGSSTSVSKDKASARNAAQGGVAGESRRGSGSLSNGVTADVDADRNGATGSANSTMNAQGDVNRSTMRRLENNTHKAHRSYARRLNKVEAKLIDRAKKSKDWTREEVQERRERINEIRARLRDKADKNGDRVNEAENAQIEADIKAQEEGMARIDRDTND